jgi:hypothetical protein
VIERGAAGEVLRMEGFEALTDDPVPLLFGDSCAARDRVVGKFFPCLIRSA